MVMNASRGFTVVEMVIAMSILAIIVAIAAPSLTSVIVVQQVKAAAQDVYASLSVARSEALTRNTSVTVAPVGGNWAQGWTVTDAGGTVLRRQDGYPKINLSGPAQIVFNGDGRPDATATPFGATATGVDSSNYRCVRVRLNGRSSIKSGACS
jgi:type IV fimbrial biogenesis protein FimT